MEKNKKYIILSELHGSPLVFQHELVQVLSINEEIGEE